MKECCPTPDCPLDTSYYYGDMPMTTSTERNQFQHVDDALKNYAFDVAVTFNANGAAGAGSFFIERLTRPGMAPDKYALNAQLPQVIIPAASITGAGTYTATVSMPHGASGIRVFHTLANVAITTVVVRLQVTPTPEYRAR